MRYLCISDIHIRADAPICRERANWTECFNAKIGYISTLNYNVILDAGDVFHRAKPSPADLALGITSYMRLMKGGTVQYCGCAGNHDMPRHNPALAHESGLGAMTSIYNTFNLHMGNVWNSDFCVNDITGEANTFPYGTELTKATRSKCAVWHTMCWHKTPPFPGLPDTTEAGRIQRKAAELGYELIVTGHNHRSFYLKGDCVLINPGGIMRSAADEKHRIPTVYIYDSNTREVEEYPLNVKADDVHTEHLDTAKEKTDLADEMEAGLQAFIKTMDGRDAGVSFRQNMEAALLHTDVDSTVKKLVEGAMN